MRRRPTKGRPELAEAFVTTLGNLCLIDELGHWVSVRGVRIGRMHKPGSSWLDFYAFFGDAQTLE